ncbi:hypothetical protein I9Y31_002956 [Clostridium perfringens]|nr:hypothetical protein [Clostridium perfringens]
MEKLTEEFINNLLYAIKKPKNKKISLPLPNEKRKIELVVCNNEEKVLMDIHRSGRIEMKITMQNRYRSIPIVRLDVNSPPHYDIETGTYSSRNHIHFYNSELEKNETYDLEELEWFDLSDKSFNSILDQFCKRFNILLKIQGVI